MKITTQFDLSEAARAAALAIDETPLGDQLKTQQGCIAAFTATGLDDANYPTFAAAFNLARGLANQRNVMRSKAVIAPAPVEAPPAPAAAAS